jgi:3-methyladenine DNA glycosylase Tag
LRKIIKLKKRELYRDFFSHFNPHKVMYQPTPYEHID